MSTYLSQDRILPQSVMHFSISFCRFSINDKAEHGKRFEVDYSGIGARVARLLHVRSCGWT